MYIYIYAYIHMYKYIYIYTHTYTYAYAYTCIYIYMWAYIGTHFQPETPKMCASTLSFALGFKAIISASSSSSSSSKISFSGAWLVLVWWLVRAKKTDGCWNENLKIWHGHTCFKQIYPDIGTTDFKSNCLAVQDGPTGPLQGWTRQFFTRE